MNKIKKIFLAILSVVVGLVFGLQFATSVLMLLFRFCELDMFFDMFPFSTWLFLGFSLYGFPVITGVIFGLISWGKLNSENWKINRYFFILLFPVIFVLVFYGINFIIGLSNPI